MTPRSVAHRPPSCRQVGRLLQRYLDGALPDARAVLVADHLDDCRRCGLDAAAYRWLKARLAGLAGDADVQQLDRVRRFAEQIAADTA